MTEHPVERTASYEADPEQMGRVLLLYSGGLDTSVMLRWIQERYGAEIVALTVNLVGAVVVARQFSGSRQ